jgi:hypothetical protein
MGALFAGVFCGVLPNSPLVRNQDGKYVTKPEWSNVRSDRKICLLIPNGLRHREYSITDDTETSR